jgi:hypothetical protein
MNVARGFPLKSNTLDENSLSEKTAEVKKTTPSIFPEKLVAPDQAASSFLF